MACGGCQKKAGERGSASLTRSVETLNAPDGMVLIVYGGTLGNHFVFSPTHRVNGQRLRYGYYSRGDMFYVYEEDVQARPDLFAPVVEAQAVDAVTDPELLAEDAPDAVWADDVLPAEATPKPEPEPAAVASPAKRSRKKAS